MSKLKPPTIDRQALRERIVLAVKQNDSEWDRLLAIGGEVLTRQCGVCDGKRRAFMEVLDMLERMP